MKKKINEFFKTAETEQAVISNSGARNPDFFYF